MRRLPVHGATASAFAPAKVILLGEHTVVYGEPAVAAALDRGLRVTVTLAAAAEREPREQSGRDERERAVVELAAARFGLDGARVRVEVQSDVPMGAGLGSSAALGVGLVRALGALARRPLAAAQAAALAAEIDCVFHGQASGVDVAAVASGGVIWFERFGEPQCAPIALAQPLELVVGSSGEPRSTAGPVARLRARREAQPRIYDATFRLAGELVRAGRDALVRGDAEALGATMDALQGVLNGFGVSTPTLERMIHAARSAGALGAKLTGAGGGGAMIALAPGRTAEVAAALRAEGFDAFAATIGRAAAAEEVDHARIERRA